MSYSDPNHIVPASNLTSMREGGSRSVAPAPAIAVDVAKIARIVVTPSRQAIRSVITGRKISTTWVLASFKAGVGQPCESAPEYGFAKLCEVDTDIVDYQMQPHRLEWIESGRRRIYLPDCMSLHADGAVCVWEVKDRFDPEADPEYAAKLASAERVYRKMGWQFRLLRSREIFKPETRFENIQKIFLASGAAYSLSDRFCVEDALSASGGITTAAVLANALNNIRGYMTVLGSMMVDRVIDIDLHGKLGPHTTVRLVPKRATPRASFDLWKGA